MLLATALAKTGDNRGADEALEAAVDMGRHRKATLGPDGKYAGACAIHGGRRVLEKFDKE